MGRVLWIDDAASYMLQPLVRMLRRRGFEVTVYTSYQEAMEGIEAIGYGAQKNGGGFPDAIVDLVIPRSEGGTLDHLEVGLKLVRQCAQLGARRVIVFSVVSRIRVSQDFAHLEEDFKQVKFFFLEKTAGRATELVESLVSYLGGSNG